MIVRLLENNIGDDGLLTCSECGASGYKTLIKHIVCIHKMTTQDYLSKYPDDVLYTDEMKQNFSKGGYNANKSMQDKGLDFSDRARKARATEMKNNPDAYYKRNRKLYDNPEFRERAINRLMNTSTWHRDRYKYNNLSLRSSWEVKFAEWLDSQNIEYEYEKLKFNYFDPVRNMNRTYYPDFYLPKYDMCVEVKPKAYINNLDIQSKRKAVEDSGYKFLFITQDELDSLSTDLLNV